MRYGPALTYFAFKPGTGLANLAYGSLCLLSTQIVPFLGQIILLGYLAEVAEDLDRDPETDGHDDFTFDRFMKYLARGVYPFLVQLLLLVAAFAAFALAILAGAGAGIASDLPAVGIVVGLVVLIIGSVGVTALTWPVTLHAQLSRGINLGENFAFTRDFLGRVGWDTVGVVLAFVPISFGVTILGLMACLIGVFPAMTILLAAQEHLMVQLYHRYLDAGGEPISRTN